MMVMAVAMHGDGGGGDGDGGDDGGDDGGGDGDGDGDGDGVTAVAVVTHAVVVRW